ASPIAGNFYVEIVPKGENPHFEEQVAHSAMFACVRLPNSPQEITATRMRFKVGNSGESEAVPFTESDKIALDTGKAWIVVHGDISYRDGFQTPHLIKFCFWAGGKPYMYSAQTCTAYNSIDQE